MNSENFICYQNRIRVEYCYFGPHFRHYKAVLLKTNDRTTRKRNYLCVCVFGVVAIENENKQKFWQSPTWILELKKIKFQKTFKKSSLYINDRNLCHILQRL